MSRFLDEMKMDGKTVLITGASSGIGLSTVRYLDDMGARVILVARNMERLENAQKELQGKNHISYSFDLSKTDRISDFMETVREEHGELDGLFCPAGTYDLFKLSLLDAEEIHRVLSLHYSASILLPPKRGAGLGN